MRRLATSRLTSITAISRAPREKSGAKGKRDIRCGGSPAMTLARRTAETESGAHAAHPESSAIDNLVLLKSRYFIVADVED